MLLRKTRRHLALLAACGLLLLSTGCVGWQLTATAASFGLGWLTGMLGVPTTTETLCYRNGVPIDCSEMPDFTE
jgi:hypothetical protein